MVMVVLVVFLGVFALAFPLAMARGGVDPSPSEQSPKIPNSTNPTGKAESADQLQEFRKKVLLSAIPWVNQWLLKIELAPRVRLLLYQARLKWTVGSLVLMCGACFAVSSYAIHLRTGSVIFAVVVGLALGFTPFAFVLIKRGQQFRKFEEALPEALDLIVSALRVGLGLHSALGMAARECSDPVGPEFQLCFEEQNFGLDLRGAMKNLTTRAPLQDLRIVATGILIQHESGGNLAEVLEKTASVIRERFRIKRQIRIHTAQGRLTGWILTLLPIGLGVILYILNPVMMSVLWTRPLGIKLLWGAAGMMTIGTALIQKIVRMEV